MLVCLITEEAKYCHWTLIDKVFQLVKSCIHVKPFSSKLGGIIWEILLYDSSVHSVLWSILSLSTQLLEVRIFLLSNKFISFATFTWNLLKYFSIHINTITMALRILEILSLFFAMDLILYITSCPIYQR